MKTLVRTTLAVLGIVSLAACSGDKEPTPPEGTTVPESEEWTAKPEGGVNVTLPETPVTTETATPAKGADTAAPPPARE